MNFKDLPIIKTVNNPALKLARKLSTRQGRKKLRRIVCEGSRHCSLVRDPELMFFADDDRGARNFQELKAIFTANLDNIGCYRVKSDLLDAISQHKSSPGVLVVASRPEYRSLDELKADDCLVVLEDLADPYNCGTIIRTADALGFSGVVITKNTVDPFSPKAQQGAMGSEFHLPFYQVTDLLELRDRMNMLNLRLIVADLQGIPISEYRHGRGGFALLIGNEGHGISDQARHFADDFVTIPLAGKAESLNAGVAFGIAAYKLLEIPR